MKKMLRIITLMLALVMVATCFIACKEEKPDEKPAGNNNVVSTSGEYQSKLTDTDWGGDTYLVLGQSDQGNEAWKTFEIARDEMPDDVVGKAVWERNDALKQKYNFIVEQELVTMSYTHMNTFYASNEDKYDLVLYQLEGLFGHMQSGFLLDFNSVNNIDLEHPSWNDFTIEQLTFGSSVYAASSDFNLQNRAQFSCIFYNREIARDGGDGYIEDLVTSNQWTLDKYTELVKAYAEDTGGNGTKGNYQDDTFGSCGDGWNFLTYATGAGYRASTVKDGVVEMAGAGDNILNILDKVGAFFFDSQSNFITGSVKPLDYGRSWDMFMNGRALFGCFQVVDYDREFVDATFELGVLPTPKYNAEQENFYTQVNNSYSSLSALPKTAIDPDFSGFGLEALTEYSTDTTLEAYIETKCKLQDSFDQRMSDMYTIIFENPVYDLVMCGDFGNLKRAMTSEIPNAKNAARYATMYAQRYEAAQEEINEIMEDLGIA